MRERHYFTLNIISSESPPRRPRHIAAGDGRGKPLRSRTHSRFAGGGRAATDYPASTPSVQPVDRFTRWNWPHARHFTDSNVLFPFDETSSASQSCTRRPVVGHRLEKPLSATRPPPIERCQEQHYVDSRISAV